MQLLSKVFSVKMVYRQLITIILSIYKNFSLQGVFTRLKSPFEGNVTAWQFADEHYVILCVYRVMDKLHAPREVIRMANVPQGVYRLEDGTVMTSDTMMHAGVTVAFGHGDFASRVMVFEHMEDAR